MEAHLAVEEGADVGQVFVVALDRTYGIGRRGEVGVHLGLRDPALPPGVSAAVRLEAGGLRVVDLGGPLGTTLNEVRLPAHAPTPVAGGDALGVGPCILRVTVLGGPRGGARPPAPVVVGAELPPGEFDDVLVLGQGGMGRVYSAARRADGRRVAIKVLWEKVAPDSCEGRRFLREAHIGRSIDSPFVVSVLDLKIHDRRAMIVMELVEGPSLDARFRGPWEIALALRVAEDVARALTAAAAAGVIHRDVKPPNVLMSPEGRCKLTDFGIARKCSESMASLTAAGAGLGTLVYMPPEQISEAKEVDPRADLYSLGVTLFELIAGRPPFHVATVADLVRVAGQPAPHLATVRADCPPAVAELVAGLLEKDPFDRPASAELVVESLRTLRERLYPGHRYDALFPGTARV